MTVSVETSLRTLTLIWRGDLTWAQAQRSDALKLHGSPTLCRGVPGWFILSGFASVPRAHQVVVA